MTTNEIISLAKKTIVLARNYREACKRAPYNKFGEQEMNTALTAWELKEKELSDAIIKFEDEEYAKRNETITHGTIEEELFNNKDINNKQMFDKEKKQFTRLTFENSYGHKITQEWDSEDVDIDDLLQGFYTALIGATWHPCSVLRCMKDFSEDLLSSLEKCDNDDDE